MTCPEAPAAPQSGPPSEDARKVADRLAEFVAKNGRSFEELTRSRNTPDGPFRFLYEKASAHYAYYDQKIREFEAAQKSSTLMATAPPIPPPPAPPTQVSTPTSSVPKLQPSAPEPFRPTGGEDILGQQRAKQPAARSDSVAVMEAFAAAAKQKEESREEAEARIEHLNETSFDRRRKVAVYKQDGRRGHHMQDFIPPEELAAFLAKSGDEAAAEQAAALEKAQQLGADNVGHRLLAQMGWKEGQGLGALAAGRAAPVAASGTAGIGEKRGLGAKAHGEVEEGDDAFEQYRKRMMLGYKHRPNPLGNPRKSYY